MGKGGNRERIEERGQNSESRKQKAEVRSQKRMNTLPPHALMTPGGGFVIKSYEDLIVYQAAFSVAQKIFHETMNFPKEELYSLTTQIRRSSRSVVANIAEGHAKRRFENIFKRHLLDAYGSCIETKVWLHVAFDCGYIKDEWYRSLLAKTEEVARMTYSLMRNWRNHQN